jgi:catechol 2,3-dioxygenase-like lactoylglutathione lyase family enzyme
MIKISSISGVVRYVKDLDSTAEFYEKVGFRFGKRDADRLTFYVNWFWVEFHTLGEGMNPQSATNEQLAVSVEGIDELCESLRSKGIAIESEPQDQPWGRREFSVVDPDGYKLLFFKKK